MANFNRPFNSTKVTRTTDDNDTPQQKKFEAATGKDSDGATGDVAGKRVQTSTKSSASKTGRPSGVSEELWTAAEESAVGLNGGFAGVGAEGKRRLIQEQYDKMVESDRQTKEWAAGSGILGDIGDDKPK